jgi:hypothetical protein
MLLVQATLSAPLEALVKESGSSKLRNRVLQLQVASPIDSEAQDEFKRTESMESVINQRQHAKTASMASIPGDVVENSQLLKGSDSPV